MYHLATVFPVARRIRLPLSRDQLMLLMAAVNEIFLSVDIYLAHSLNGQITRNEWIPIFFGVTAGIMLLGSGVIALRNRPFATVIANIVFVASIVVGLLGMVFHISRTSIPGGPVIPMQTVNVLIWSPPLLGPSIFALVGVLGISAAWIESPPESGRLWLFSKRIVQMPYSKTRAYFFIVSIAILVTIISSVLDHSRINLENPWVWLPTMAGIFGTVAAATLGAIKKPTRLDLTTYTAAMVLLIIVGVVGFLLHLNSNLVAQGTIVVERFLRGSPTLAPLLFANVGLLGLLALLDPTEPSR
jgi:preprotein translocase subunit Sss1